MRISDWSSDVCSSDLPHGACVKARLLRNRKGGVDGSMVEAAAGIGLVAEISHVEALAEAVSQRRAVERRAKVGADQPVRALEDILRAANACTRNLHAGKDRKRGVEGKSVSGQVKI